MITTHGQRRNNVAPSGFTLVETMVTLAIVTLISGAMFAAIVFMTKSGYVLGNHVDMTGQIRHSVDNLSRDVHSATEIVGTPTDKRLELRVQRKSGQTNSVLSYNVVYEIDSANGLLTREADGNKRTLVDALKSGSFVYYDSADPARVNPNVLDIKKLDLQLVTESSVKGTGLKQNQEIYSARFVLRNRPVR